MSENKWILRAATGRDATAISELLENADLPGDRPAENVESVFVVAEQDGQVVGAGGVEVYGAYGLLRSVVVRPEMQGRGLGGAIVSERLRWAAVRGLRAVYLLTTTAPDFFEGAGFNVLNRSDLPIEVRESKEFSEICPVTATAMVLRLEPVS
jgi:amino-acid N-acetyltransferase